MILNDTVVALATASGSGAIAVIRLSGPKAITICNKSAKKIYIKVANKSNYHKKISEKE